MPRRRRLISAFVILLTATACNGQDSQASPEGETYGFVATLGNDTTSVERITRTDDRIVSDAVGRSPNVVRRRWEATLAPDGSVLHWTMHTHIPNADEGAADLYHEAVFDEGTVRLIRRTSRDTTDVTYAKSYAVTVPWNAFVYGTYEVLFQAARGMSDTTRIGQYFFEGWAEGSIGYARVRALGGDSVDIRSTGLSGAGVAHLDPEGRLLSYSGAGTTYVQEVERITDVPDIDAIATRFAETERTSGVSRSLSPRDTSRATVGDVTFVIDYSRPLARGRTLVGGLIPTGRVWRTGANAATQLSVSAPVEIGGILLDSGTYTLWTLPADNDVQLIINRQSGQWGTQYGAAHDIARVSMQIDIAAVPVEQFTIRIDAAGASDTPRLVVEWGTFRWSVPVAAAPPD
jgi:hypothetical protein